LRCGVRVADCDFVLWNRPVNEPQRQFRQIDAVVNDGDGVGRNAAVDEIGACAFGDRLEGNAPIEQAERPFRGPDHGGDRCRRFIESRGAEQVMDERHGATRSPPGREEEHLVDVLDQHIGVARREHSAPVRPDHEGKGVAGADAVELDAVERRLGRSTGPPGAQERDLVSPLREPPEDFVEMRLGAAGVRVFAVLPVDEGQAQGRVCLRTAKTSDIFASRPMLITAPFCGPARRELR
jgi:hypothetical protein